MPIRLGRGTLPAWSPSSQAEAVLTQVKTQVLRTVTVIWATLQRKVFAGLQAFMFASGKAGAGHRG